MIRFGVVGLSRGQSFVDICQVVGGASVTALFDVDLRRAEQVAGRLGARAFSEFDDFLNGPIDAVVVASPLPFHGQQAAAALRAGKHVLSEVTACLTLDDAHALVATARAGSAVYMLSENYRYLDEIELLKRMHAAGRFGELYYGEGEYIHDCRGLWHNDDGTLTWRGRGLLGVYGTHSLGPLLYILDERVMTVSAVAVSGGKFDPAIDFPTMHLLNMVTERGTMLRVRVDHVSPRPHASTHYALQGTRGCYEAQRGFGDDSKVWLADEHEPSLFHAPAQWHALADQAPHYIADRLAAPPEARSGGHGTSEYWLLQDFLAAVRGEGPSPIDVNRGLDYTLPCLCAAESAAQGGTPVQVPDPRDW